MKILIWSGYQSSKWNLNTWLKDGIGGSEYCILQLAIALNKLNHNVTVSGDVENGDFEWKLEMDYFVKTFTKLAQASDEKVQDSDLTYAALNQRCATIIKAGDFPNKIAKKKTVKPVPQ